MPFSLFSPPVPPVPPTKPRSSQKSRDSITTSPTSPVDLPEPIEFERQILILKYTFAKARYNYETRAWEKHVNYYEHVGTVDFPPDEDLGQYKTVSATQCHYRLASDMREHLRELKKKGWYAFPFCFLPSLSLFLLYTLPSPSGSLRALPFSKTPQSSRRRRRRKCPLSPSPPFFPPPGREQRKENPKDSTRTSGRNARNGKNKQVLTYTMSAGISNASSPAVRMPSSSPPDPTRRSTAPSSSASCPKSPTSAATAVGGTVGKGAVSPNRPRPRPTPRRSEEARPARLQQQQQRRRQLQ